MVEEVTKVISGFNCDCCGKFVEYIGKDKGRNYGDYCSDCHYLPSSCNIGKCKEGR